MIPPCIHSIWLGNSIPSEQIQECLSSQMRFFGEPEWKIMEWTDANSPKLTCPLSSYAATANVLRLWVLYEFGGIFLDADVEVLKPFDPLLDHEAFIAKQPDGRYCNAVMGATPRHAWVKWMLDRAIAEQEFHDASFCCHIINDSPMEGVTELPTEYFYPFNWNEEPKPPGPNAYAIHHFEGSWISKPEETIWP